GTGVKKVDVRIVAATNRNLEDEVKAGHFREDLYYRLNVIPLHLPPLRERGEDVILLAEHFLHKFCAKKGRKTLTLNPETVRILQAYTWPGNVRELENFMERLSILTDGLEVTPKDLPAKILNQVGEIPPEAPKAKKPSLEISETEEVDEAKPFTWPTLQVMQDLNLNLKDFLEAIEANLVNEAIAKASGVKNVAAEYLGIKRTTLIEKLKKVQGQK
ncbi:MAG: sigma-54-dependent Fis family transcriptional regulator, partial [Desulfovibrionaceae bacterium]|nr:sigma-54-dependent Fis family transcriptional regulator [Desulfovibrionaceae bacterium]